MIRFELPYVIFNNLTYALVYERDGDFECGMATPETLMGEEINILFMNDNGLISDKDRTPIGNIDDITEVGDLSVATEEETMKTLIKSLAEMTKKK